MDEMREDDWRYRSELVGSLKDWRYLEWKFFSFDSPEARGFFCYSVGNPRDISGLRKHIISYAVYHDHCDCDCDGVKKEIGMFEVKKEDCDLSGENRWVFGDSSIRKQHEDNRYFVSGAAEELDWDLVFECKAPGGRSEMTPSRRGRWMDWEVFCNDARVKGSIEMKNESFDIDGRGYHDSNLGHWRPAKNPWVWFRFTDEFDGEDISFALFEPRGTDDGTIFLSSGGETHAIKKFDLTYAHDNKVPRRYRIRSHPSSNDIRFDISVEVKDVDLLAIKVFKFIPLLKLRLLRCRFKIDMELFGERGSIVTEGFGEYPARSIFL